MRVGLLGGTFDPIHIGHLIAASEVHTQLTLDQVTFIPAGQPWQKSAQDIAPAHHRLAMVEIAIEDDARFAVSDIDIQRSGPTYSIDTLVEWTQQNPRDDVYWIVGADALAGITSWHRWEEFVERATIVCVNRPNGALGTVPFEYIAVQIPEVHVSATHVRERLTRGSTVKYLVPDEVIEYVQVNGLYRS